MKVSTEEKLMLIEDMTLLAIFLTAAESTIFYMAHELTALCASWAVFVIILTAALAAASMLLAVYEVIRHIRRNWSVIYLEDIMNTKSRQWQQHG